VKKILIAPNSFKESASSVEVATYFQKYLPPGQHTIIINPISDGGDGFLSVCQKNYDLEIINFMVSSPYSEKINFDVPVGYSSRLKTIFIESAEVLGLKKIPPSKRHPMDLSSAGMGQLLTKIKFMYEKSGLNKIIIGIGGTGTIDMGIGILSSFGLKLLDKSDNELAPVPKNFVRTKKVQYPKDIYPFKIEFIVDVNNPLLGANGGIKIYGTQKGALESELSEIEGGIKNIIDIFRKDGLITNDYFISGAGGGISVGLSVFLKTEQKSAKDFILNDLKIKEYNKIDYMITGEGKFDYQSYNNKGTGILLNHFKNIEKIFLCCGIIDKNVNFPSNIDPIQFIDFFKNIRESSVNIEKGVEFACSRIQQVIS
jgi:glycerate 2-kinase